MNWHPVSVLPVKFNVMWHTDTHWERYILPNEYRECCQDYTHWLYVGEIPPPEDVK